MKPPGVLGGKGSVFNPVPPEPASPGSGRRRLRGPSPPLALESLIAAVTPGAGTPGR